MLTVFRSSKHTYAQLVDRVSGHTLATASTLDPAIAGEGSTAPGLELLLDKLRSTKSNDEFLADIAKAPSAGG